MFLIKKFLRSKNKLSVIRVVLKAVLQKDFVGLKYYLSSDKIMSIANIEINKDIDITQLPIRIFSTKHCTYIAKYIAEIMGGYNFKPELVTNINYEDQNNYLYIIISPNAIDIMPDYYVAFQVEQTVSSRWINDGYLTKLRNAYAIFDYSLHNITYWNLEKSFSYKNIYYMPIGLAEVRDFDSDSNKNQYEYDVLFYGDVNCSRRKLFIEKLQKKFNVKIAYEVYSDDLYEIIRKSKVVINVHYYEGAILETTRLFECLSLGKIIVSEEAVDQSNYSNLSGIIDFVQIGDIESMISKVEKYVSNADALSEKIIYIRKWLNSNSCDGIFYLGRFLLNYGFISFSDFYERIGPKLNYLTNKICLSIPEEVSRRNYISTLINDSFKEDNISFFDGVRKSVGYLGCGLSFKLLLKHAVDIKLGGPLLIFEDDISLSDDSKSRIDKVLDFANNPLYSDKWDIISGFMAEFNDEYTISDIFKYNGITYIATNKMVSTVFNIYNKSVFHIIANWDETNEDRYNQIDQYLKKQNLKVLLVYPYLVDHNDNLNSAVWEFSNKEYNKLIDPAIEYVKNKISGRIIKILD